MILSNFPKLILLLLALNSYLKSNSQDFGNIKPTLQTLPTSQLNCLYSTDPLGCNFIQNDQFTNSVTNTLNPFPFGEVPGWVETHGSPALTNFLTPPGTPPAGIAAYSSMYSSMYSWYSGMTTEGEGIAQKITPLEEGNAYAMSFFKKLAGQGVENMGKFYIVLLHCEDYESIHTYPSYTIPTVPRNSQVIYCENSVANTDWQQVFACFRAIDNYDLVWIFPVQDLPTETLSGLSGVDFSGLELINTTNFSAGVTPSPTNASPVVNIGPSTPNCGLRNAVFSWYGPNGQIIVAGNNQTINVDASDSSQQGDWTLKMNVSGAAGKSLNNPCKQLCYVSNVVTVPPILKNFPTTIQCNRPLTSACNLIENSAFSTTCYGGNPFYNNCVNRWDYAFASPQLNTYFSGLDPNNNTASMWALTHHPGVYEKGGFEGIATGIPNLIVGHRYNLSFYKAAVRDIDNIFTNPLDEFNIVLMNCASYNALDDLWTSNYTMPSIPNGAQIIYCEKDVANNNLQRVSISFTAISNYDILWIFPKHWKTYGQMWFGIAKPELIDVSGFSAGPERPINPSTCNVTIGPSIPNCGPSGATFMWYPPNNGNPIAAPSTQQLSINASLPQNVGTWILKMIIPNTVTTYNNCSDNISTIQATVNVGDCVLPGPPIITTASYFEYGGCSPAAPPNSPITPNNTNQFCYYWECGGTAHFKSSINNGNNQWYVNDVLVPAGFASSTITGSTNTSTQNELALSSYQNTVYFKVQVKNTTYGYTQLSAPTYIYFSPTWGFSPNPPGFYESGGWYKQNYTKTFTPPFINHGPNAVYTWSVPGCVITDLNQNDPSVQIYFPANVPTSTIDGTLTITNSYCNRIVNVRFFYNINARNSTQNEGENNNKIQIYPNPAMSYVTINAGDNEIQKVEIRDLFGFLVKEIYNRNSKIMTFNISHVKPGIYNCRITTNNGVQNEKLTINR